ncbi:phosphatidate cytidylyltransferase [Knoellia subterranea]|uniref:Phosphatidate cytidylyltransferase n=1 Tax=Knoellia subterranea KCTC 19937 TaxID=1385521 RepID=A0A0A0JM97_9MICO|nr:phosphatidate cytidylyltransferase [Knoellia subterranea]KGN36766.1 phosphatidate cytidylyltransferase [Knoellia subterranea KCTC 19937]
MSDPSTSGGDAPTRTSRSASKSPAKTPTKAGRNLPAAIGVGVVLGALVVASLAFDRRVFLGVVIVAMAIGAWEMRRAVRQAGFDVPLVPVVIGAASMVLSAYFRGPEALLLTFGLTCVGILVWRVADGLDGAIRDIAAALFVAMYPCFLGGFAALLLSADDGHLRIVLFVLVTVASDIGGYAFGVFLGKHPMAPSLSPKKSWEGFGGSVFSCALVGAIAIVTLLDGTWWKGAVIGMVVAAAATIGDLIESSIKRDLGVKDMGTLLPGHGGIMDRLDSLVVCIPVVWALLLWALPA